MVKLQSKLHLKLTKFLGDKMNENIDEYMESFKNQTLKEKQNIIFEQLQMLTGFTNNLCKKINIQNEPILNRELLDLKNDNYTEDDFAEAIVVLINSIQNSICDYANGISDLFDKMDNL